MTDTMSTARMIQPADRTQGPLAVGDRRHRERRQTPVASPRAKSGREATQAEPDRTEEGPTGKAIDIRI